MPASCLTTHVRLCSQQQTCVRRSFAKASASAAALRWRYALRAVRTTTIRMARASSGTTPAATASSAGLVRPITSSAPITCRGKVQVHCRNHLPHVQAEPGKISVTGHSRRWQRRRTSCKELITATPTANRQQPGRPLSGCCRPQTSKSDRTPRCPRLSATAADRRWTSTVSRVSSSPFVVLSKNACMASKAGDNASCHAPVSA